MKLNLGSRDTRIPGFTNIDISKHPNVDYVCDVSELSGVIGGGCADEIIASHVLEHFPHYRTKEVLLEWKRVLKNDGILWVSVPDFDRLMEIYSRYGLSVWLRNMIWGDQSYGDAFHKTGFTFKTISDEFEAIGMSCQRVAQFPFSVNGCDDNVFNFDGRGISLRVKATKKCPY